MNRRQVITALGTLTTGTGIAMGTGAFTTTSAERSFDVSTAADDSALLSIDVGDGTEATNIVDNSSSNSTVSVTIDNVNRDALTAFDGLLSVTNLNKGQNGLTIQTLTFTPYDSDGDEISPSPLKVYKTSNTDPINENSLTVNGISNSLDVTLTQGNTVQVGFVIDTTTESDADNVADVIIAAETDGSGSGDATS